MADSKAYYNEHDPKAANWLRELIRAGHIAPGEVDERDIQDVTPNDLRGYTQHHFFAGIGVWSYALRLAGWPDSREVWTGSCPCQPFSSAGRGKGVADERHLWPAWNWLIKQCRPNTLIGEQVASRLGLAWFDIVSSDLENQNYAVGAVNLPACGVGAPHLRQRTWWVGQADPNRDAGRRRFREVPREETTSSEEWQEYGHKPDGLGDGGSTDNELVGNALSERLEGSSGEGLCSKEFASGCSISGVALGDSHSQRPQGWLCRGDRPGEQPSGPPSLVNGFWANAEWLPCKDGKSRAVEPGTFPLVDGTPGRVGLLRGYGNAINAQAAKAFIQAVMGGQWYSG